MKLTMSKEERIEYLVDYIDIYLDGQDGQDIDDVSEVAIHYKDFAEQTDYNYTQEELKIELKEALQEYKKRYQEED